MKVYFGNEVWLPESNYAYPIGAFDGFHKGHRAILEELKKFREKNSIPSIVSFFPHPDAIFRKNTNFLFPIEERIKQVEKAGIDVMILLRFSDDLAELAPEEFVKIFLKERLHASWVVIGKNFTFGKGGEGDSNLLIKLCKKYGLNAKAIDLVYQDGRVVSSSFIGEELRKGNVERVRELLGYDFYIKGKVIKGDGIGRKIGFPTANIESWWKVIPEDGVYAFICEIEGINRKFRGALSIGPKPTFGKIERTIEIHILEFDGYIYGREITVWFLKRLRDIMKFRTVEGLAKQIKKDIMDVREVEIEDKRNRSQIFP